MTLLNPIWLWGLGGLAIPVVIHLLSRKEGKTIRIGSIRFLTETSTSKFSSIRLNEVALLAVRSLLLVLIVLFLAGLLLSEDTNDTFQKWVVVEKGLENDDRIKNLLDSLKKDDFEVRRFSSGFPVPENDTVTQPPDYYKLTEELSLYKNVNVFVLAGNTLSNFKGKRISLPDNVTWFSNPVSSPYEFRVNTHIGIDSVHITVAYEQEFQYDKKILLAALRALQREASLKIYIEETEINRLSKINSDWLIWLSRSEPTYDGKLLRLKEDLISDLIVQESRNKWFITKRLNEENAIEQHLTIQLMNMLFNKQISQEISTQDNRILPDELAWVRDKKTDSIIQVQAGQSENRLLILLVALLLIIERILAFYRKQ